MTEVTGRIFAKDGQPWESWKLQPPPEKSLGVGPWCYQLYERLRRHRDKQGLPELWARFHELYRGKIFKRRSKWAQVIANLIFKNVNALKNNITDNKPRASIIANGETAEEAAKAWQVRYDTWWDNTYQQNGLTASVFKSELMGFQVDHMRYNPDLEGGIGDIETKRNDTYGVLLYPGHINIQTQPAMVLYEALELGEIYGKWPEAEGKVSPDREYSEILGEERRWTRANRGKDLRPMGYAATYVVPGGDGPQAPADVKYGTQRALVIHVWVKDYTMMWVDPRTGKEVKSNKPIETGNVTPVLDQITGEPVVNSLTNQMEMEPEVVMPEEWSKYPGFIRCISVTNKGNLVLSDLPNPSINPNLPRTVTAETYLWDKLPFIKRLSISDDVSEYGLSVVEQLETLVVEVCKKLTRYSIHLDQSCRNPLILPQGCGVDEGQVNNLPARIWRPVQSMAANIKFLEIPSAPQDIITFIELCIRLIDIVSGITDVSEGRKPGGVEAYRAIAALQEKAQTVFRDKIRHNDIYLEEQGRMFISLGQNWYTEHQLLKYEGKSGEQQTVPFRGVDMQGEFAFHVEAGSTLPRNRGVRQGQVIELAKAGKIPDEMLFEELGFPDAKKMAEQNQAGPLGMALRKLEMSGLFNPEDLQAIQNVLTMDDKTFARNFGSGNPLDVAGNQ